MNYTIIGHSTDTSYHDRGGDFIHEPGAFVTFFTNDEEAFVKEWASMEVSELYEDIVILLNGVPDSKMSDEEDIEYFKLEDQKNIILAELKQAKIIRTNEEGIRRSIEAAEKLKLKVQLQAKLDLEQYEALKKKLGI